MARLFWVVGFLCVSYILCACSGGGEPGRSGDNAITPTPRTADEALQSLSQKHRAAFENWKSRLVKSCDGSDSFGTLSGNGKLPTAVDLSLFFKQNGHSLVVSEDNEVALLGAPHAFGGFSTSQVEETETVDGKTYKFQAELKQEGFKCSVSVYGQKVLEVNLAEKIELIGYWNQDNNPNPSYRKTSVSQVPATSYAELKDHGLVESFADVSRASDKAFRMLGKKFGITEAEVGNYFQLYPSTLASGASAQLLSAPSTAWFNASYPRVFLSKEIATKLLQSSPQNVEVEWRVGIPKIEVGDLKNDADGGALRFVANVQISKKNPTSEYGFASTQIKFKGMKKFDPSEASQCVVMRTKLVNVADREQIGLQVRPSFDEAVSPCGPLTETAETQVLSDGTIQSLIPQILQGVRPSPLTRYNGWEDAISVLALTALGQDKNVAHELDPAGITPIVQALSENVQNLKREIEATKYLVENKPIVYALGMQWALTGQSASQPKIRQIVAAADNAWSPFKNSTAVLLRDLATNLEGEDSAIQFALGIDLNYKTEANRALTLANSLDYSEWQRAYFDQVIQKQIAVDELSRWSHRLQTVKTEIEKFPGLQKTKGGLTRLALKWLDSGEVSSENLGKVVGAINNAYAPFEESTNQLIADLGQSLPQNKPALDFAAVVSADYKRVAASVRDKAAGVGMEDWGKDFFSSILQKRPTLDQVTQWEATFVAAAAFTQKEHARMQGESEFINESYRKDLVKKAVNESWSQDEFAQLEQISQLAKFKLACDPYKGVSSLANCATLSLFSKGEKKYFDPRFNHRYGALAQDFIGYMNSLPENENFSLRTHLMNSYFGSFDPIWSSCFGANYDSKASTLRSQLSAYVNEGEQFKKWELERGIRSTLENCEAARSPR